MAEIAIFDQTGIQRSQMPGQLLAGARARHRQRGYIQYRSDTTIGIMERGRSTAQIEMAGIEMIGSMAGQRLLLGNTGANAVGPDHAFIPDGTRTQPGRPQSRVGALVAAAFQRNAVAVGQHGGIALTRDMAVQLVHSGTGDIQIFAQSLSALLQIACAYLADAGVVLGLQAIFLRAPQPRLANQSLTAFLGHGMAGVNNPANGFAVRLCHLGISPTACD